VYAPFAKDIYPEFPGADAITPNEMSIAIPVWFSCIYVLFLTSSYLFRGPLSTRAGIPSDSSEPSWKASEDKAVYQQVIKAKTAEDAKAATKVVASQLNRSVESVGGRAKSMQEYKRGAMDLSEVKIVYNAYQVVMNIAMVSMFAYGVYDNVRASKQTAEGKDLSWVEGILGLVQPYATIDGVAQTNGLPGDVTPTPWLRYAMWIHYTNKFIEYVDTVFMILEQRWN